MSDKKKLYCKHGNADTADKRYIRTLSTKAVCDKTYAGWQKQTYKVKGQGRDAWPETPDVHIDGVRK
jgi:hypothetical protein